MPETRKLAAALLVYVAKGDGSIADEESAAMMQLLSDYFAMSSAESLSVLRDAMGELAASDDAASVLNKLSEGVSTQEKEEIALMMLKTVAADGRRDPGEMEKIRQAAEIIEIPPDSLHRAYDRYFEETQV